MSDFRHFKKLIQNQYDKMTEYELFETEASKDEVWDTYLNSFEEGKNLLFRERTEHDCQCCYQFLRVTGNVVAIIDNKLVSIWDIETDTHYQSVANALSNLVKSKPIANVFRHYENRLGTDYNHEIDSEGMTKQWSHFYYSLPNKFVMPKDDIPTYLSKIKANKDVLKSGFETITLDAIETVMELIEQNSLYRGEEKKLAVASFLACKLVYEMSESKDTYSWSASIDLGMMGRIKNSSIGTLLVDISEGVDLNDAVRKYRKKVDPENYQQSSPIFTKGMKDKAEKKVKELGLIDSLPRRYAVVEDVTINNVLFANRKAKEEMNVFDELEKDIKTNPKTFDEVEEVNIEQFISDILPKVDSMEIMFENKHENNLMSLISPKNKEVKPLFKWNNNFCWNYNGDLADSLMKERVKKAGGNVEGDFRFSIQWNDGDNNQNDFDAHAIEPNGNVIYYPNKRFVHHSSGMLDVDIVSPGNNVAVENIIYTDKSKMPVGVYNFLVHNFSHSGGRTGFTAEIEFDSKTYSYSYDYNLSQGEKVIVATVKLGSDGKFSILDSLDGSENIQSKELWGINTNKFHEVSLLMNSPNHWDGNSIGNKHWFFILKGCKKEGMARGFFNEYLRPELREDRKVFQALSSKLRVQPSDNQLSGLGFSSTLRNSVLCKIEGSFSRILRINF